MNLSPHLHPVDWVLIGLFFVLSMGMGLYFTRRAARDLQAFFVSDRSLPWYLVGISIVATSFAADTPLWVTSLVRQHGLHYVWQYWVTGLGATLAIVLFARLWQRMGLLTDLEFIELRYSSRCAAPLRMWNGFSGAIILCPLVIGWVTKAMETILRESIGLPPEYRVWSTALVLGVALVSCALSGLWGVIYTDFLQFFLAFGGTLVLAFFAVTKVGGLGAMTEQLTALSTWPGHGLSMAPQIGAGAGRMSLWNAVGYFGILWISVGLCGGYQAQRLFSCKNSRHASLAMLLNALLYTSVIIWPWILVALCSVLLLPALGPGVTDDSAYPRMIVTLLPAGLRGLLVLGLLSAFMSTISTLLNWGSSYAVNDLYKRFLVRQASHRHYVTVGRVATAGMAAAGAVVSFYGRDVQHLLTISMVVSAGSAAVGLLRWFWWRMTAAGELTAALVGWVVAPLMLFARAFDRPYALLAHTTQKLSDDPDLLGARMTLMLVVCTAVAVGVSLLGPQEDRTHLERFVRRARPFRVGWGPIIGRLGQPYAQGESLGRTLASWAWTLACIYGLNYTFYALIMRRWSIALASSALFIVALAVSVLRIFHDTPAQAANPTEPSNIMGEISTPSCESPLPRAPQTQPKETETACL